MTTMAGFGLGVAGLLALAGWMLLPAMRRAPASSPASTAAASNLRVLKEQLSMLDDELAQGRIDAAEHEHARIELQHRVLDEAGPPSCAAIGVRAGAGTRFTLPALAAGMAALALALYGALGNPDGLQSQAALLEASPRGNIEDVPVEAVVRMVDAMAERLRQRPPGQASDAQAWTMLAHSYAGLQRFSEAGDAYARASELAPDDAQLLADRADVLVMQQGRRTAGEPARLVERALALDPENLKALALAGSAAFEHGDFAAAAGHWNRALDLAPRDSSFAQGLERSLAEARSAAGEAPSPAAPTGSAAPARISGSVRLSPALAASVAPTDTVFIVARAVTGPRLPLAVMRRTAAELPIAFVLDDGMAMSPEMKLSNFARVVVTARVSRSGNATPQPGDLHGQSLPVGTRTTGLQLTIEGVQP